MSLNDIYPRKDDKTTIYLKNVITKQDIIVGDYTIYNDFEQDPVNFEKNNVLYHYPINHDKLILFLILSKFDINMLNRYFLKIKNTTDFIENFVKLPDEVMKSIISRNYHLFQYIMIMMAEVETTQKISAVFMNRYHEDIKQFSRLSDILRKYRENNALEKEKELPFNKRDMSRLSFLVNMVRELPDPVRAVDYFNGERVFIDEMEKNIVLAVVTDPLLKNIFRNYNVLSE